MKKLLLALLLLPMLVGWPSANMGIGGTTSGGGAAYTWSYGDLASYESRIPLLAAHDWSNALDSQAEIEAAWTGETVVTIQATDCDAAAVGSDEDRAVIQNELTNNKIIILSNADSGGPQSPCYYDFTTAMGGSYNNLAIIGEDMMTTVLNFDIQTAAPNVEVANALQLGTEAGLAGTPVAYTGSLAQGTTTLTAASGTWAVLDPVVIDSTDADGDNVRMSTFLVTGTTGTTLVLNDPIPFAYGTGTVQKMTNKKTDLVLMNFSFDMPYAWRGTCANQVWGLGSCRVVDFPNRSRTVISNVNFIKVTRNGLYARYTNNTVIKHSIIGENLALSRSGTQNGFVNGNGLEGGTDRIYDNYFRQGAGRLYGKPSRGGNSWYGFLAYDEDQSQIGDPSTGYTNAGSTVHDTGGFYRGGLSTDDATFPVTSGQGNSERQWFLHDCADGFSDNATANVFEASELEGIILADTNCDETDSSRYHTFYRLFGADAAADIDFDSSPYGILPWSNWIMVKANDRQMSTASKENNLTLYNLSASRDSNAGTGASYVSTGDETGSSTLSTCGSRDMPPSVVLRQDEPPCWWCAEYGDASNNYGWNGGWDYGACDSSSSPDLPAKRRFQSVACTAPPTCVDY